MNEDPQPKSFINQINYQSQIFAGDKIRSNITIINMNDDKIVDHFIGIGKCTNFRYCKSIFCKIE